MTFAEFVEGTILCASIHFECASTRTKKVFPMKGPVWSMCILCQGQFALSQGCSGAVAGDFCVNWHGSQSCTFLSMSASMLGHNTILLAILFILSIPGWPSCSSFKTCSRPALGITSRVPHIKQPSCVLSSSILLTKGCIWGLSSGVLSPCYIFVRCVPLIREGLCPLSDSFCGHWCRVQIFH